MEFQRLVDAVQDEPLFETSVLFAGKDRPEQAQRQVADWTRAGRLVQLRRGLYVLSRPYRKMRPHPFVVANRLMHGSYVSLQMALSYYSLIPEHVAIVTSVTTARPGQWNTQYGRFAFRHVQTEFFYGFEYRAVSQSQYAFVATPEKALLDLVYLQPGGDKAEYLTSLRLQNLDRLDVGRLFELAQRLEKPKLEQAAHFITNLVAEEAASYQSL